MVEQPHGIEAPPNIYEAEWLIFLATLLAVILWGSVTAARSVVERPSRKTQRELRLPGVSISVATVLVTALGLLGAIGHAVFVSVTGHEVWSPSLDTITIGWLGVAVVGMLLPRISEFTFAGVNVRFSEVAKAKEESEDVILSATDLAQNWSVATNDLLARLEDAELASESAYELITQFLQLRAYEALEWLGVRDGELRRLSVWLYDAANDELFFFFSNEIADPVTVNFVFPVGSGVLGVAFREHRVWNERDAPALPVYIKIRKSPPRYRGLLCIPVDFGSERLGILSVDRESDDFFGDRDVNVMKALAATFGIVLGNKNSQTVFESAGSPSELDLGDD